MKVRILREHHVRVSASKSVAYRPSKKVLRVPNHHGEELLKNEAAELIEDAKATQTEKEKES